MNQKVTIAPDIQPYRSFVYRKLQAAGAHFQYCREATIAAGYAAADIEQQRLQRLALADLSPLPRLGFKGRGVPDWLAARGVTVPSAANSAIPDSQYGLVARLGYNELLLLGETADQGGRINALAGTWQAAATERPAPANLLPRAHSHASFGIYGAFADRMFAKLCGVDLQPAVFANHAVALTSVARVAAIIIRHDHGGILAYRLLIESGYAPYMLDCLTDAMSEFDGGFIGFDILQDTAGMTKPV